MGREGYPLKKPNKALLRADPWDILGLSRDSPPHSPPEESMILRTGSSKIHNSLHFLDDRGEPKGN